MATTQENRHLKIYTPLGEDVLLLERMRATEAISELFRVEVDLLHAEESEGYEPTAVDVQKILGKGVSITVAQADNTYRILHGIVQQFSQGTRHVRFSFYNAVIVPHVWLLTQNRQSRIFQNQSVPDILRKVLEGFDFAIEVQGDQFKRNYCVQYRESDWEFASRLMEEEGYYYFFEHTDTSHRLVIANDPSSHRDCPGKSKIEYFHKVGDEDLVTAIHTWVTDNRLQTGKVTYWDHNFELPNKKLDAVQPSRFNVADNQRLEAYDYPGGYARKFDGIDSSGGGQSHELSNVESDKTEAATIGMQALDALYETGSGTGDCSSMTAGYKFEVTNHPNTTVNGQYIVTSITHEAVQSPSYVSDQAVDSPYRNTFRALAHGAGKPPFRPMRVTPKPIVHGSQTAVVVGPGGEEIFTDKYGRVKVQFHWDREGNYDSNSSCWVRVAQGWAGKKWGMVFTPRIGMEVIVHFLEGDPDRPIITGCVYNANAMPPYTLPDEKTKSTIKSDSSKGGGGFNEIRIEDKKDSEQLFIHAQKDQDIRVLNDCKELIKHDRHLIVENEQFEEVKKDKHLKVKGDHNEGIDGGMSHHVGGSRQEKVDQSYALDASQSIHIKAGMSAVIEAGTALTLKVGGNFININSGGIFIKGTMVMLNSGGMAGSGAGSNPTAPTAPKEADTADPGERVSPPPPVPPLAPKNYGPMAIAFKNAAESGTAFCNL
jgi:type VI secretion system secreted protein VgrG